MSSAICFNLDQSENLSFGNELMLLHFSYDLYFDLLPVQNDKILGLSKLKAFADDNINVTQNLKFVLERMESIMEKRRKCWLPKNPCIHLYLQVRNR